MRSRATHPRALLRLVASASPSHSGRQAASQSVAALRRSPALHSAQRTAASTSGRPTSSFTHHSSAATSSAGVSQLRAYVAPSTPQVRRRASLAKRRASRSSPEGNSDVSAKRRSEAVARITAMLKQHQGHKPARPPPCTHEEVMLQAFFSNHRPLLEHGVKSTWSSSYGASGSSAMQADGGAISSDMEVLPKEIRELVSNVVTRGAKHLGGGILIAVVTDVSEVQAAPSWWPNAVRNLSQGRFCKLLDNLSKSPSSHSSSSPSRVVVSEANKLAEESRREQESAEAVANALERGEDPSVAKALGPEADLVILGEPEGPRADWAPGTATFMANNLRAFEPPSAPRIGGRAPRRIGPSMPNFGGAKMITIEQGEEFDEEKMADRLSSIFTDGMDSAESREFGGNIHGLPPSSVDEDAPNLLLSHAMVQASLPSSLAWDRLVSQMDAAALNDPSIAKGAINTSLLNAGPSSPDHELHISLDSVRRKRKKKMRKHKYKKLRKRTRIQRQQK